MNQGRIDGIVDRISSSPFEDVKRLLKAPLETFARSVVDDHVKANEDFHYKAGMKPKIVRKTAGKWCRSLTGTFEYPKRVLPDVFRRHEICRCKVEYWLGVGRSQNVHDKTWLSAEENLVTPDEVQLPVIEKQQRKFHAGPEAARIRERILDSSKNIDAETMEKIVGMN